MCQFKEVTSKIVNVLNPHGGSGRQVVIQWTALSHRSLVTYGSSCQVIYLYCVFISGSFPRKLHKRIYNISETDILHFFRDLYYTKT